MLVHFIPHYMTKAYIDNEVDVLIAEKVIFDRLYWDKLDAGTSSTCGMAKPNKDIFEHVLKKYNF